MTSGFSRASLLSRLTLCFGLAAASLSASLLHAQVGVFRGVVGGVSVDAEGVVQATSLAQREAELANLRQNVVGAQGDIAQPQELRMVSLKGLQQAIVDSKGKPLAEEIEFLAGLQRVEYVFVYPEQKDIVIAGPAEGWNVRGDCSVVGTKSSRPVVRTEDLITAFRTVEAARRAPISVSIDPTPEGEVRLKRFLSTVTAGPGFQPQFIEAKMREAFGPQQVKFTTVSTSTRMAQTLVAADYRMKLLAMNLEESPVAGLPSYLEMIRGAARISKTQPRWWMACQYDAIEHSQDRLAWHLDGRGVKAMTEEEFVSNDGKRSSASNVNKAAQAWADAFTAKFDELSTHNSSFGELRNAIDLNVIATLISAQQLEQLSGCDLSVLRGVSSTIDVEGRNTPKTIPPHCSFLKGTGGWIVTASGGVEINPWQIVAESRKVNSTLTSPHCCQKAQ